MAIANLWHHCYRQRNLFVVSEEIEIRSSPLLSTFTYCGYYIFLYHFVCVIVCVLFFVHAAFMRIKLMMMMMMMMMMMIVHFRPFLTLKSNCISRSHLRKLL